MATRRVEIGPTGETVRANVARVRKRQGLTLRDAADRLTDIGHPMAHNTVSEIERGARRVDVDDLMALAAALDVSPATLLMPATTREEWDTALEATGQPEGVTAQQLWAWLTAKRPPRIPPGDLPDADEYLMCVIGAVPPGALTLTAGTPEVIVTANLTADGVVARGND
jgi:transcriptional regulator with XRE-family HTH domain